jgi:hypothetical protein
MSAFYSTIQREFRSSRCGRLRYRQSAFGIAGAMRIYQRRPRGTVTSQIALCRPEVSTEVYSTPKWLGGHKRQSPNGRRYPRSESRGMGLAPSQAGLVPAGCGKLARAVILSEAKNPGICGIKQIQRSFVAPQGGTPQDDMLGGFFRSLLGAGAADATACSCCEADTR